MRKLIRPLFGADTLRGWLYAFFGAVLGLFPIPVATVVAAVVPREWAGVRTGVFLAAWAGGCAAAGCVPVARRACVRLTNRLLGTALPVPAADAGKQRVNRLRTAAWSLSHVVVGGAVTGLTGVLVMMAVGLPAVWGGGGGRINVLVDIDVARGAAGLWTVPAGAALLAAAGGASFGATALFRSLAPVLLGPRPDERLAALEAQMRRLAQRNRLAQELHDSIGHTLTASTIQAAVAKELMDTDPDGARRALTGLEETSRAAMDDLDHVLGLLREDRAPTAPALSLTDLHALVDRVRRTGTDIRADITGDLARVPATVSREAYRVVQEGLTNALRHGADRSPIDLRVAATVGELELEIRNPVAGRFPAPRTRQGQGVTGVMERVRLLKGEVSVGPAPGGTGWLLAARIPLRSAP